MAKMTKEEVRAARERLGLTQAEFGRCLEMTGAGAVSTVGRWEYGALDVSGPARVAIRAMLYLVNSEQMHWDRERQQWLDGPAPQAGGTKE